MSDDLYGRALSTLLALRAADHDGSADVVATLIREIQRLEAIIDGPAKAPVCTGVSAGWCPRCGDCTCPNPERAMDDPKCPLHSPTSEHATTTAECSECSGTGRVTT